MNRLLFDMHTRTIAFLVMIALILSATVAYAAYRINRPVGLGDEPILQTYLYGEGDGVHKGIDFSTGVDFGDSVYAVAGGRVVQIEEGRTDGCHPLPAQPPNCPAWGNYVLIQHNGRHYDKVSGQMAYMYSLYLHLRQNSVVVVDDQNVDAGTLIAQAGNTGNSSGDHVHLQIIIHSQSDREIEPINTLESETRSRNPELWLTPYNGNTGTVIGKVTNISGDAVGNRLVCGLQKAAAWGYGTSLTYNNAALNPDDVLVENWGTTDVTPGTYAIHTCPYSTMINPCACSNPLPMGTHMVQAGQVTYVGLYPVWLPYVRSKNGWNSTVVVRNNSDTYRAQVNVTLFNRDGTVYSQRTTDSINARATLPFGVPSGFDGGMLVVSSEDIAVEVREESGTELNEYNGIMASTNVSASLGWERAGSTVYVPLIKNARYGRSSKMFIMNTGQQSTVASVEFFNADGVSMGNPATYPLNVNASQQVNATNCGAGNRCSAKITSSAGQPLAVTVLEQDDATAMSRITYTGFSAGSRSNFVPLLKNARYGMTTGLAVRNLGASSTTVTVTCYDASRSYPCGSTNVPRFGIAALPAWPMSSNWVGWAVVTSTSEDIVTAVYESGNSKYMVSNAPLGGTATAYAPELYGGYALNGQTWDSGISVQNASSSNADVTVTYYDQAGTQVGNPQTRSALPSKWVWILNRSGGNLPNNFAGSAVITTNQSVVAIVNTSHTGSGDTNASYTVPNR